MAASPKDCASEADVKYGMLSGGGGASARNGRKASGSAMPRMKPFTAAADKAGYF